MQNPNVQTAMQPFFRLFQSNMSLLTQFYMSPEVMSQAMSNAQSLLQKGPSGVNPLAQSTAFTELTQGLLKNYTEFISEVSQSGVAMMTQGPSALMQKTQEATDATEATEPTDTARRRSR